MPTLLPEPSAAATQPQRRYLDLYEPLRPDLYRYCRHLVRSPWEAEDLAQDTMARAFVTLAGLAEAPQNPRAWLFRVASNLWIDRVRHVREMPGAGELAEPAEDAEPRAAREAAGTLMAQLSPQERAAVVLKDVFDLSLDEIAEALSTTTGAIKAALHRGRGKLVEPTTNAPATVAPAVLDAFCAAFNARDIDRLTSLLLDASTVEMPGVAIERGPEAARSGSLYGILFGCSADPEPWAPRRSEVRAYRGEWILLWWRGDVEVNAVVRVEIAGDRLARIRNYFLAPDVITEVCRELGVPFRTHGYRL
ncbi:MAG: RNA polymerase sigma factor [Minicystis sp.]